jgi:hypothetical protein
MKLYTDRSLTPSLLVAREKDRRKWKWFQLHCGKEWGNHIVTCVISNTYNFSQLMDSARFTARLLRGPKWNNKTALRYLITLLVFRILLQLSKNFAFVMKFITSASNRGARGSVVVKALCYKPEGRGFDSRWGEFLNLANASGRSRPWGLLSL